MKLFTDKNFSSLFSLIFHVLLFLIIVFYFNQKPPEIKDKVVEIGFGGTVESNSPGSPGRGDEEEPVKQLEKVKTKIVEKKKSEPKEETLNDKNKSVKKNNPSTATGDSTKGSSTTGTGSGSGTGSGTGGNGNGQPGSGPEKKGLYIPNDIYYVAVDQMPVPVGGSESINQKTVYPQQARSNNIQGTVYVLAFIDERGNVKKTSLIKGIGYGCDQSASQAVKSTRFEPGILHGMTVKVQLTVPVIFSK
jgi:protein TonB